MVKIFESMFMRCISLYFLGFFFDTFSVRMIQDHIPGTGKSF